MGKLLEGVWDCQYCGAKKIRGSIRECPACGHPRDENITFYLDDPTNYVPEDKAKTINRNPDWVCPFCNCLNSDDNDVCEGCGAARDASTKTYFENKAEQAAESDERDWETQEMLDHLTHPGPEVSEQKTIPRRSTKPWKKIAIISAAVLLTIAAIVGLVFLCLPKEVSGTIQDMSWERVVEIEEYKTVRKSDWSIPVGGREVSRSQEIHHYNQVIDHNETKTRQVEVLDHYEDYVSGYRDLGNGYFEEIIDQRPVYRTETETYQEPVYRDEPVYQTKYVYDIEEWVHKLDKKTSGNDKNPVWATYDLGENERRGSTSETYKVVVLNDNGKTKEYTMDYEEWLTVDVGQTVEFKVSLGHAKLQDE